MPASTVAYRAAWLFPVDAPPIRNAVLEVDASGRIADIRCGVDRDAIDLGCSAVVPALVNAHAHLEFSNCADPIGPAQPFTSWVRNVVAHRRSRSIPVGDSLSQGFAEARRTGTVAIGEIQTAPAADYPDTAIDVTLFREVIGPLRHHWPALLHEAETHLRAAPGTPRVGLSPHAPHTVPQELFEGLVETAVRHAAPVAVHLAETKDELRLLRDGTGDLVEMMKALWLWEPASHPTGRQPLDWLCKLARTARGLVIHGNYLDPAEIEFLATHPQLSLVYCPRTHAYFGHPPHPFVQLLARGGRVALGTDGRSSNPDLDLWREAEFVSARHPDLPSGTILELATKAGAEALGVGDEHGVLTVGRRANFLAVPLEPSEIGDDPPHLFATDRRKLRVFHDGIELDRL